MAPECCGSKNGFSTFCGRSLVVSHYICRLIGLNVKGEDQGHALLYQEKIRCGSKKVKAAGGACERGISRGILENLYKNM